jgi:HlyD family secretion protein
MSGFFRKSALEKLSTPEQLDQLIKVTTPKGWIMLSTIFIALLTAILWSFFGNVKTKLNVVGVILGGELHEVVSTTNGQLLELKVEIGQKVNKDDVIAVLHHPEILQQINSLKAIIGEREIDYQQSVSYGSQDSKLQS